MRFDNLFEVLIAASCSKPFRLGSYVQCSFTSQEIDRNMADNCHVFWSMINAKMRSIFVKDHIETPMQVVFNRPMRADMVREVLNTCISTIDKITRLLFAFIANTTLTLNHTDIFYSIPATDRRHPTEIVGEIICSCF